MAERDPDALGWRTLIGFGATAAALAALATPALLLLAPAHRTIALRVLTSLYAAGALPRLLAALRAVTAPDAPDRLARLLPPPPLAAPDPVLLRLAAQLRGLSAIPPHLRLRRLQHTPLLLARLRAIAAGRVGAPSAPVAARAVSERAELDQLLTRIENAP